MKLNLSLSSACTVKQNAQKNKTGTEFFVIYLLSIWIRMKDMFIYFLNLCQCTYISQLSIFL